jgi:hypothetical protein
MAIETIDGSKTKYTYLAETVAGTPDAGAYQTFRAKAGIKLDITRNTFTSNDLRADRMESSLSYGTKSGSASFPIEWSYGTYDDLVERVMGGTWTADTLVIGNTERTLTVEEAAANDIVEIAAGIQLGGFSISKKNDSVVEGEFTGIFRDLRAPQTTGADIAVDATALTITRSTAGFNTLDGFPLVTAGVPLLSVSMKGNSDAGNNDTVWVVTTLTDTVMTMTTMAGAVTATAASGITVNQASNSTSVVAATTNPAFDSLTGSVTDATGVIGYVTGWDLKVDQEVKPNFALDSDATQSVSMGTVKVSGNLTVYYVDQRLRRKFLDGTDTTLSLVLGDSSTGTLTFDMNTVSYTSNTRDNTPLARIESIAFVATYTTADLSSLKITRAAAA